MRIISGTCKGRRLSTLKGRNIRPTSDRVRESLFNIISWDIQGARVLDLFAGTGALGIEALSRGALLAVFVDTSQNACHLITQNCKRCDLISQSMILRHDLLRGNFPPRIRNDQFDIIFMDPPYDKGLPEKTLLIPDLANCLAPEGRIIVEHSYKEKIPENFSNLDIQDQRKYGKTLITFFTAKQTKNKESN